MSASAGLEPLSPLFNYYWTRRSPSVLDSVSIADGISSARSRGVCPDSLHSARSGPFGPFRFEDALLEPTPEADDAARRTHLLADDPDWNTLGYYLFSGRDLPSEWRAALSRGIPIVVGFYTTQRYQAIRRGEAREVVEVSHDSGGAGHVALVVGCDGPWFTVRDCQGSDMGEHGNWRLHESVVMGRWVAESWAIAIVESS